jgi:hypothetical protein
MLIVPTFIKFFMQFSVREIGREMWASAFHWISMNTICQDLKFLFTFLIRFLSFICRCGEETGT